MSVEPLKVACTGCPKRLRVPATAAGKKVRCPACQTVLVVPFPLEDDDIPVAEVAEIAPAAPPPAAAADPFDFFAGEPAAPAAGPPPDQPFFHAIEPKALASNRVYQVHPDRDRLVGLYIGAGYDMGPAAGAQLGLAGGLVAGVVNVRAAADREKRLKAIANRSLDELLTASEDHFEIPADDVDAAEIAVPSNWFAVKYGNVPQLALLTLTLTDGTTRLFSFADVPDIRAGLALLPAVLGDALKVRIVWDSRGKKFVARR
jgi:LSD1 subclass zinc finger protein